jgi:hypothetical protein
MYPVKELLKFQIRMAFVSTFQRICHHEIIVARSYRALADRHLDDPRRSVILILADVSDRRANHYAVRISRLGSTFRLEDENWPDRLWYWLLIHSSVSLAIRWVEWVEHGDNRELTSLIYMQNFWK